MHEEDEENECETYGCEMESQGGNEDEGYKFTCYRCGNSYYHHDEEG